MRSALTRLGFIDETSLKTNMAKTTGWSPKGARLVDHAPFGHWNTQTFIAALRHDRLDAPWVIDGAMNRELFELYVETQLAPTLRPGDVIILDNLSSHKSPKAAATMSAEPDRDGLRKAQGPDPESRRANLRGSLARRRAGLRSFHR